MASAHPTALPSSHAQATTPHKHSIRQTHCHPLDGLKGAVCPLFPYFYDKFSCISPYTFFDMTRSQIFWDLSQKFWEISQIFWDLSQKFWEISQILYDLSQKIWEISQILWDLSHKFWEKSQIFSGIGNTVYPQLNSDSNYAINKDDLSQKNPAYCS